MSILPQPLDPTVPTKIPHIYRFTSSFNSLKVIFATSYDLQRKEQIKYSGCSSILLRRSRRGLRLILRCTTGVV